MLPVINYYCCGRSPENRARHLPHSTLFLTSPSNCTSSTFSTIPLAVPAIFRSIISTRVFAVQNFWQHCDKWNNIKSCDVTSSSRNKGCYFVVCGVRSRFIRCHNYSLRLRLQDKVISTQYLVRKQAKQVADNKSYTPTHHHRHTHTSPSHTTGTHSTSPLKLHPSDQCSIFWYSQLRNWLERITRCLLLS